MIITPGKPTKLKKIVYILAAIILGLLLSVIVHSLIEINYLHWALSHAKDVKFYGGCALHPVLQGILWVLGFISGLAMGRTWWKKVYIERVWTKKK